MGVAPHHSCCLGCPSHPGIPRIHLSFVLTRRCNSGHRDQPWLLSNSCTNFSRCLSWLQQSISGGCVKRNFQNIKTIYTNKQPNQNMGTKPQQVFLQRRHTDSQQHRKRCFTLLIIREMHIKITVRYHLIPVRIAIIKKSTNNKYWRGCGEGKPSYTVWGNVSWCSHYGQQCILSTGNTKS